MSTLRERIDAELENLESRILLLPSISDLPYKSVLEQAGVAGVLHSFFGTMGCFQGTHAMNKYHYVENVRFEGKVLHLVVDGDPYRIDVTRQSARLRDASLAEIQRVEVSPSGYGLHWPEVDEDLSIDGMLGIRHEIPRAVAEPGETYGV